MPAEQLPIYTRLCSKSTDWTCWTDENWRQTLTPIGYNLSHHLMTGAEMSVCQAFPTIYATKQLSAPHMSSRHGTDTLTHLLRGDASGCSSSASVYAPQTSVALLLANPATTELCSCMISKSAAAGRLSDHRAGGSFLFCLFVCMVLHTKTMRFRFGEHVKAVNDTGVAGECAHIPTHIHLSPQAL